ncbi:MAG: DUF4166 domain-containing protein [Nitratireductor sp.]
MKSEKLHKQNLKEPIFKPIFGKSWEALPPVFYKHYANRANCLDTSIVEGKLDVMCKWFLKPSFWFLKVAPPYSEKNVSVSVHFTSQLDNSDFSFDRVFYFKNRVPFHFKSKMRQISGNEVREKMSYGICWHSLYSWEENQVRLTHKGYSLSVGRFSFVLPITWLIGRSDAYETAIDENSFYMCATITHPLFGKIYEYKGQFKVVKEV